MAVCYRPTLAPVPTRCDVDRNALVRLLAGEPRYRINQVWDGLYRQLATPGELTAHSGPGSTPTCRRGSLVWRSRPTDRATR